MEKVKEIIKQGDYILTEEPTSLEEAMELRKKVLKYSGKRLMKNGKLIYPRSTYVRLKDRPKFRKSLSIVPFPELYYTHKYSEPKWVANLQQKRLYDLPSFTEFDVQLGEEGLKSSTTKKTMWGTLTNIMSIGAKVGKGALSLIQEPYMKAQEAKLKAVEARIIQSEAAMAQAETVRTIKEWLPYAMGGIGMLVLAYFYYGDKK